MAGIYEKIGNIFFERIQEGRTGTAIKLGARPMIQLYPRGRPAWRCPYIEVFV